MGIGSSSQITRCGVLGEKLRLIRIEKYGPGSEKLSDDQLELLELEPGVSSTEVEAESQRQQLQLPLKKARQHPGRQQLPAELPRVEQIIRCTADQCVCTKCGKETTMIGYESAEQLDVEPARYFVRVTKREKRACKECEEQGVQSAPLPARIIDKGLASDRCSGEQIRRPCAPVQTERDSGKGDRDRALPGDSGWLGDAGW